MSRLVAYFSASGVTKRIAEIVAELESHDFSGKKIKDSKRVILPKKKTGTFGCCVYFS